MQFRFCTQEVIHICTLCGLLLYILVYNYNIKSILTCSMSFQPLMNHFTHCCHSRIIEELTTRAPPLNGKALSFTFTSSPETPYLSWIKGRSPAMIYQNRIHRQYAACRPSHRNSDTLASRKKPVKALAEKPEYNTCQASSLPYSLNQPTRGSLNP